MLKLMKYEFRKQAFTKLVILSLIGLLELVFFFGVVTSRENVIGTTVGLFFMFAFGALFYLAFESIFTFSNDLKQKSSYMLFLTPNSTYSIVGAKVLAAAIQIVLAGIAFFAVFAINGGVLIAKYDMLAEVKRMILELLNQFFQLEISFSDVASVTAVMITSWISTITIAFFSITLSTTFLADKKFKGVISFAIFIGLNILISKIVDLVLGDINNYTNDFTLYFALSSLFMVCFTIITYVGTAWMLDKKVSV
jgi:hypothetical protein